MDHAECCRIASRFAIRGKAVLCGVYGFGHINATYLVATGAGRLYVLQKINSRIFKRPLELMENIIAVTEHLQKKTTDPRGALHLVPALDGRYCYRSAAGDYWRMYDFITDGICLEAAETAEDFYQSAVAFGAFQNQLSDFPAERLHETIPDFHNTPKRYEILRAAAANDVCARAARARSEIAEYLTREAEGGVLYELLAKGELPLRVTHNDTKLNNVMLDFDTRKPLCVMDLDTVMPGLSLYDFGDSIRFGASTAAEDERDLDKVALSLALFETYTRGYLASCGVTLTPNETALLPMGAKIMTLECGVRFLTDYLEGDVYFKTHSEEQNLVRARTQLKLVMDMEKKWTSMVKIVANAAQQLLLPCSVNG